MAAYPRLETLALSVVLKPGAKGTSGGEPVTEGGVTGPGGLPQDVILPLYLVTSRPHRKYRTLASKPGWGKRAPDGEAAPLPPPTRHLPTPIPGP